MSLASVDIVLRRPRTSRRARAWSSVRWALAGIAVLMALALASGLVGTVSVVSPSMAPGFDVGARLVTTTAGAGDPHRGDVVVVEVPGSWHTAAAERGSDLEAELMVKRVVAVGGDRVTCCAPGGILLLNGEVLDEDYLADLPETVSNTTYDVTVPAGYLWLLGDNRRRSFDSRAMHARDRDAGFVPASAVRARVLWAF